MSKINGSNSSGDWGKRFISQHEMREPHRSQKSAQANEAATPVDERPMIRVEGGDQHIVVDRAEAVIAQCENLYQHANRLVLVTEQHPPNLTGQVTNSCSSPETSVARMEAVNPEWLTTELSRRIRWINPGSRNGPPHYLARALIGNRKWPNVRTLEATTASPILRPDGTVRTEPGYDRETRLLLTTSEAFLPLPDKPSKADAQSAIKVLLGVFQHYLFDSHAHASTALSLILTRLARHLMPLAPFHLISSSSAGTGKTEVIKAVSWICDGADASLRSWPKNDEELHKVITSCLLASKTMVCFDNFPSNKEIASPVLDQILTAPFYEGRVLGKSKNVYAKNNLVLVGTGNNVRFAQDSIRRVIVARVLPVSPEPWKCAFPWTPSGYARTHRRELLRAACTVLSAFIQAGKPAPDGIANLGSFEEWSTLVRNALIWLDQDDPCVTQDEFLAADSGTEDLLKLIEALRSRYQDRWFSAADVIEAIRESPTTCGALRDIIQALYLAVDRPEGQVTAKWLGRYFYDHKEVIVGGQYLFAHQDKNTHTNRWCIRCGTEMSGVRVVASSCE